MRRADAILLHGRRIVELNDYIIDTQIDNVKPKISTQQASTFLITMSISLIYDFMSFR